MDVNKGKAAMTSDGTGYGDRPIRGVKSEVDTDYHRTATNNTKRPYSPGRRDDTDLALAPPPGYPFQPKKKRGRPRKYPPRQDTSTTQVAAPQTSVCFEGRRASRASRASRAPVPNQVPSVISPMAMTVYPGENVTEKIMSFSRGEARCSMCILAATGTLSTVTISQPNSVGGTMTYQGKLEIVSLSGSFIPSEGIQGMRNSSGGMSISMVTSNGQVIGGAVVGALIADGPIQVVLGRF